MLGKELKAKVREFFRYARKELRPPSRSTLCARFPFECFSTHGSECPIHIALGESCKESKRLATLFEKRLLNQLSLLENKALRTSTKFGKVPKKIEIEPRINYLYERTVELLQEKHLIIKGKQKIPWKRKEK